MRQPTLRPALTLPKVYLYRDPIDFPKSHRGLSALVELELGPQPFSGELYVFTNKQRNKIKWVWFFQTTVHYPLMQLGRYGNAA